MLYQFASSGARNVHPQTTHSHSQLPQGATDIVNEHIGNL